MNANEVIIPCRLSYANIWEPKQVNGTGDPKYSCCLLIKKSDTAAIAKLKAAIEAVKKDPRALARWGGSVPKNLKLPLRDGDKDLGQELDLVLTHYFKQGLLPPGIGQSFDEPSALVRLRAGVFKPGDAYGGDVDPYMHRAIVDMIWRF